MNSTELFEEIQGRLAAILARCYYQQAPQTAALPYIVWDTDAADIGIDTSKRNDFSLKVNLWGNLDEIATLETLADSIADLNLSKTIDVNQSMFYNLINKQNVPTGDENLRRKELTFTIRTYPIG